MRQSHRLNTSSLGNFSQDRHRLFGLSPLHEPPHRLVDKAAKLREAIKNLVLSEVFKERQSDSQWRDDDDGGLRKQNDVEYLPVPQRLQDPRLDRAANGKPHGKPQVAYQAPPFHRNILECCKEFD